MSVVSVNFSSYYSASIIDGFGVQYGAENAAGQYTVRWDTNTYSGSIRAPDIVAIYNEENLVGNAQFYANDQSGGAVFFSEFGTFVLGSYSGFSRNIFAINTDSELKIGFNYNMQASYMNGQLADWGSRWGTVTDNDSTDGVFYVGDEISSGFQRDVFAGSISVGDVFVVGVDQDQSNNTMYGWVQNLDTFIPFEYVGILNPFPFTIPSLQGAQAATPGSERAMTTPLEYIASYADLRAVFGTDAALGASHRLEHGLAEGRSASFKGLDYIASYTDLIAAFGADRDAGARHYITHGAKEGRVPDSFDGARYLANYADLRAAFGADTDAAAAHFITFGHAEGRTDAIWA